MLEPMTWSSAWRNKQAMAQGGHNCIFELVYATTIKKFEPDTYVVHIRFIIGFVVFWWQGFIHTCVFQRKMMHGRDCLQHLNFSLFATFKGTVKFSTTMFFLLFISFTISQIFKKAIFLSLGLVISYFNFSNWLKT